MAAVSVAPSAGNLQAYQVYVVKNRQAEISLANAAFGQDFVAQALPKLPASPFPNW